MRAFLFPQLFHLLVARIIYPQSRRAELRSPLIAPPIT